MTRDHLLPSWISTVEIREATEEDLPGLEWEGEYKHFRRLFQEIYQLSTLGKAVLWVADLPGTGIIGQVFVQLLSNRQEFANGKSRAYIYGFRVRQQYRRNGIGTRLMQVAETDLAQRGYRWVTLNVARDNPDARRLYERRGYRVIGHEPGHWSYQDDEGKYHEVHEPAWRMEKKINNPSKG